MNLSPTIQASPKGGSKGLFRVLLAWAPVWIAFAVLGQVALLGLRPAMAERRKLAEAQTLLRARIEREEQQAAELERLQRAQNDPIFLERERRVLRASKPARDEGEASEGNSGADSGLDLPVDSALESTPNSAPSSRPESAVDSKTPPPATPPNADGDAPPSRKDS